MRFGASDLFRPGEKLRFDNGGDDADFDFDTDTYRPTPTPFFDTPNNLNFTLHISSVLGGSYDYPGR